MNTPLFTPQGIDQNRAIFLSGHVPSSKNSKQIGFFHKKTGEESSWYFKKNGQFKPITPTLRSSDQTEEYIKHIVQQIIDNKKRFKELVKDFPKPYIVQLHFIRKTRSMWDFSNMVEAVADAISGSYWKKHKTIPQVSTMWLDVDDIENVIFIPVLANMLAGKPLYSIDKVSPGVWIMPLDIRAKTQPNDIFKGMPSESLMAEIPFPNPNAKFVEELRAMDKCLICSEPLTKNDGEYCQECKSAF